MESLKSKIEKDRSLREITGLERQILVELEDSLRQRHLGSDPNTQTQWCRYCGNTWRWYEKIVHTEDCPITLLNKLRQRFDIPSWMERFK
jgi:hypothetical protein